MEVTILDKIIHGQLRPWMLDTTDTKKFSEWARTADTLTPTTYQDLQKKIAGLLTDFPPLRRTANEKIQTRNRTLQKLFYEIELPIATNPFTQFYALLISNEAVRISNLLAENLQPLKNKTDIGYEVNLTLKSIRALAKQTVEELKERSFTSVPTGTSDLTHFTLFYLKQILSILYFDVQHRYKNFVLSPEAIEKFSYNILEAATPITITPTDSYFEFEIGALFSVKDFSRKNGLDLLEQIRQHDTPTLQTALENFIFLQDHHLEHDDLTSSGLSTETSTKTFFEEIKKSLCGRVEEKLFGHERLDIVTIAIDSLEYIQSSDKHIASAPRLLNKWLQQQKEIYTARFSEKFPDVTTPIRRRKPTSKFSFCFNADGSKLKIVVSDLCSQIELLDDEKNTAAELVTVLTSKDLKSGSTKIYLGCETSQFRYVIDKLKPHFTNLTPKAIGQIGIFYSLQRKKITAQNLYSSKVSSPKNKSTIDKIVKQLQ